MIENESVTQFIEISSGAALYVVPKEQIMARAKFIRDRELRFVFRSPRPHLSLARMKMLKPGAFPSLRISIFAGESLATATGPGLADCCPE